MWNARCKALAVRLDAPKEDRSARIDDEWERDTAVDF